MDLFNTGRGKMINGTLKILGLASILMLFAPLGCGSLPQGACVIDVLSSMGCTPIAKRLHKCQHLSKRICYSKRTAQQCDRLLQDSRILFEGREIQKNHYPTELCGQSEQTTSFSKIPG